MPVKTIINRCTFLASLAITAALLSSPAYAAESLSASEIKKAVSGHTYQGSMSGPKSGFAEFYAEDGTIHGKDYKGNWTTKEGSMCFAYGEEPTCYQIGLDAPSMVLRKDGEIKGSGMLIEGNVFDQ